MNPSKTGRGRPKRRTEGEADGIEEAVVPRTRRRRLSTDLDSDDNGEAREITDGSMLGSDPFETEENPEPTAITVESRWFPNGKMPLPVGAPCDAKNCMLPAAAPMHPMCQIMAKRSVGASEASHKDTAADLVAAMVHGGNIVDQACRQAIAESFEVMNGPLAPSAESKEAMKDFILSKLLGASAGMKGRLQQELPHTRFQLKEEFVKAGCVPPKFQQDTVEVLGHKASVIHRVRAQCVCLLLWKAPTIDRSLCWARVTQPT